MTLPWYVLWFAIAIALLVISAVTPWFAPAARRRAKPMLDYISAQINEVV